MNRKKTLLTIFLFLISLLSIESPLLAYKPVRESSRQKACFSNQRVIAGAIEMYAMDNPKPIGTTLPGGDFEELENMLIKCRYLKGTLDRPEEDCSYGIIVKDLEKYDYEKDLEKYDYEIFCKKHGTIETRDYDKPIIPSYDVSHERPFSIEFKNLMAKKSQQRRREKLIRDLLSAPLFPYILVIIIGLIVFAPSLKKKKKE